MARKYTAKEMREAADNLDSVYVAPECEDKKEQYGYLSIASMMLRRAADAMEREELEKKYEYKILYRFNGYLYDSIRHSQNIQSAQKTLGVYSGHEDAHIVRRSVGEWEEVE